MQAKRKTAKVAIPASRRPEYTAAVRYLDGRCDIFRVRNANDMKDARALVLSEVGDVRALVIAERR